MNAEGPGEIAVDTSQLHSVLRTMIESGALIQNHLDTDVELQDAELLMPAIDQDLFEDDIDEEHVGRYGRRIYLILNFQLATKNVISRVFIFN